LLCRPRAPTGGSPSSTPRSGNWPHAANWAGSAKCALAAAGIGRSACHWQASVYGEGAHWEVVATLQGHNDAVCAVAWSASGQRVLSGSADGTAVAWEWRDPEANASGHTGGWKALVRLGEFHHEVVRGVAWSPDGSRALTASLDGTVRIWEPGNFSRIPDDVREGGDAAFEAIEVTSFSNGGSSSTNLTRPITYSHPPRWDMVSTLAGHSDTFWAVTWPENTGGQVLTGSPDRTACPWQDRERMISGTTRSPLRAPGVRSGAPDGGVRLVSCLEAAGAGLSRAHGSTEQFSSYALSGHVWCGAGEPPGRWSLLADLQVPGGFFGTAEARKRPEAKPHLVAAARWSPDGRRVLTGGSDGTVRIWQSTGPSPHGSNRTWWEVVAAIKAHAQAVTAVAWAPDSSGVFSASRDGTASAWRPRVLNPSAVYLDSSEWGPPAVFDVHSTTGWVSPWAAPWAAAWSPDGRQVLTSGGDGAVRIWQESIGDPLRWEVVGALRGHAGAVWDVAWSPDGSRVLTAGDDGNARIWQLRSAGVAGGSAA